MQLPVQTGLIRHSVALGMFLFGVGAPMYADTISIATVDGALGQNIGGTPNLIFDTNPQTGSPVSTTLTWSASCTTCSGYTVSGSGNAKVINGSLGASSSITATGTLPSVGLADTYADYLDVLTVTGGTLGTSGVLVLQYALDGSITGPVPDPSFSAFSNLFAADYQIGGGAVTSGSEADFFASGATSTTVTFYLPFTYGTAFGSELHLETLALFGSGDSTPFTATVDFYNTASLNSALVFAGTPTSLGTENTSAVISSDSGLGYGPNGISISAVPEPHSWFLLVSAVGILAVGKRRGAFRSNRC